MVTIVEKNETVKNKDGKDIFTIVTGDINGRKARISTKELNISEARAKELLEGGA